MIVNRLGVSSNLGHFGFFFQPSCFVFFSLGSSLGVYIVRYSVITIFFLFFCFVLHVPAQSKVKILLYAYYCTGNAACCCRTAASAAPVVEIARTH